MRGYVKPVGGIVAKIEAAKQAGAKQVLIPRENWQSVFTGREDIEIIPVEKLEEVLEKALEYTVPKVKRLVPQGTPQDSVCV